MWQECGARRSNKKEEFKPANVKVNNAVFKCVRRTEAELDWRPRLEAMQ